MTLAKVGSALVHFGGWRTVCHTYLQIRCNAAGLGWLVQCSVSRAAAQEGSEPHSQIRTGSFRHSSASGSGFFSYFLVSVGTYSMEVFWFFFPVLLRLAPPLSATSPPGHQSLRVSPVYYSVLGGRAAQTKPSLIYYTTAQGTCVYLPWYRALLHPHPPALLLQPTPQTRTRTCTAPARLPCLHPDQLQP